MSKQYISVAKILISGVLIICGNMYGYSQGQENLNKEIEVVKPYTPDVADVRKISKLPDIIDSDTEKPSFTYSLLSGVAPTNYRPATASPVKILPPDSQLPGLGYARLGFGNYNSPLGELYLYSGSSEEYMTLSLRHNSSFDKIKLDDGVKQKAPFGETRINGNYNRMWESSLLSLDLGASHNFLTFYGISPGQGIAPVNNKDISQNFLKGWVSGRFSSINNDAKWIYDFSLGSGVLRDKAGYIENTTGIYAMGAVDIGIFRVGLSADAELLFRNNKFNAPENFDGIFSATPFILTKSDVIDMKLGAKASYANTHNDNKFYVFPDVNLNLHIGGPGLRLYGKATGHVQSNSYTFLLEQNQYLYPGTLSLTRSVENVNLSAGISGDISNRFGFRLGGGYAIWDNYLFFDNIDSPKLTGTGAGNTFAPVFDDTNIIRAEGELSLTWTDLFLVALNGNYYNWDTDVLAFAPHKPDWDARLTMKYQWENKFYATFQGNLMGARKVSANRELDTEYSIDLLLKYQHNQRLGFFLNGYNLTNETLYLWNQYPSQGIMVQGGVTFSF